MGKKTELHNQSLSVISTELFRRMNLVQAASLSIRVRKRAIFKLEQFMKQQGHEEYTIEVGENFEAWIKDNENNISSHTQAKWLTERLAHCLDPTRYWINDFKLSPNYQIRHNDLKNYYLMLQQDIQAACLQTQLKRYVNRCVFCIDVYMLDHQIGKYSEEVGNTFLKAMSSVVDMNAHQLQYAYTETVARLNTKVIGEYTMWRVTDSRYSFKHPEVQTAMERTIERLIELGYKDSSVKLVKSTASKLDLYMLQRGIDVYTPEVGQQFVEEYEKIFKKKDDNYEGYIRPCVAHLTDSFEHLQFNPYHVRSPRMAPPQYLNLLRAYTDYNIAKGNSESTIKGKELCCKMIFEHLINRQCYSIQDINRQLVLELCETLSAHWWNEIKLFLEYCFREEHIHENLAFFVPVRRQPVVVPPFYSKDECKRIMEAPDRATSIGKRDYAIILLIIRLGIRSSDVINLTEKCIDRKKGRLNFTQYKTKRYLSLYLPSDIIAAVDDYLHNGRPKTTSNRIFVSSRVPYGNLKSAAIHGIFSRYIVAAGLDVDARRHGGHAFRASMATSMVNGGMTYEETRYVLGHKSDTAIRHYTSLDIERLRLCAAVPAPPTGAYQDYLDLNREVTDW